MTTVVFDGVRLACDSRRTTDGRIDPYDARPKIRVVKGVVFAGSGIEAWIEAFPDWYFDQRKPYPLEKDGSADISVFDKGKWKTYFSDSTFPQNCAGKWACGTGEIPALAAMLCGRKAEQAVLIATQLDKDSGGPIFGAELTELLQHGEKSLVEYKHGVPKHRKSHGKAPALHTRKGGRDFVRVQKRALQHSRRRD